MRNKIAKKKAELFKKIEQIEETYAKLDKINNKHVRRKIAEMLAADELNIGV